MAQLLVQRAVARRAGDDQVEAGESEQDLQRNGGARAGIPKQQCGGDGRDKPDDDPGDALEGVMFTGRRLVLIVFYFVPLSACRPGVKRAAGLW